MRRPPLVKIVLVTQICIAIFPIFLVSMWVQDNFAVHGEIARVLYFGFAMYVAPPTGTAVACILLTCALGITWGKAWGWWMSLAVDLMLTGLAIMNMARHWPDPLHEVWMVGFSLPSTVLLLLPSVRRFYWAEPDPGAL